MCTDRLLYLDVPGRLQYHFVKADEKKEDRQEHALQQLLPVFVYDYRKFV